jgi:predicted metal-binding protein
MPTAAWLRERYKRNKSEGVCPNCTVRKAIDGGVTCMECRGKKLANQRKTLNAHRIADKSYYERLKTAAFTKLGNRCNNPECRWLNADGTLGCTDRDALQIDHVLGGGVQEHRALKHNHSKFHRMVIADTVGKYQLLCANCNWIKRAKEGRHRRTLV